MDPALSLALFAPLVPAFDRVGGWIWMLVARRQDCGPRIEPSPALRVSLGLWSLAPVLFLLLALGQFSRPVVVPLYVCLACIGVRRAGVFLRDLRALAKGVWARTLPFERCLFALTGILITLQTCGALLPPLGGDPLAYHFPVARHMADSSSLEPLYGLPPSCYLPQNAHLFLAFGMNLWSDLFARLFLPLWGALACGLLYDLGASLLGRRGAAWSLFLFAFTPWTNYLIQVPCIEIPLAHLLLLSAALFVAHWRTHSIGPLILSGAAVGLAVGTKQTVWAMPVALLAFAWVSLGREPSRGRRSLGRGHAFVLVLGALLLSAVPWYLRNLVYLGNPLWPVLGVGKYISPTVVAERGGYGERNYVDTFYPLSALRYLRTLFFNYGQDCYSCFSPLLLAAVPFLPATALRIRRLRPLVLVSAIGLLATYPMAPHSSRYWFPFYALLCPLLAAVWIALSRRPALTVAVKAALAGIGLFVVAFEAATVAQVARNGNREAVYGALPEAAMVKFIREEVPGDAKVIYPYANVYVFPANVLPVWCNNGWVDLISSNAPSTLPARLKSLGARYLVYSEEGNAPSGIWGEAYSRTVSVLVARGQARKVVEAGGLQLLEITGGQAIGRDCGPEPQSDVQTARVGAAPSQADTKNRR